MEVVLDLIFLNPQHNPERVINYVHWNWICQYEARERSLWTWGEATVRRDMERKEEKKQRAEERGRDKEQWKTERKEIERNRRDSEAGKIETEDRKRGRQEERGEWLRQPIFFKQLCFHSTGHQGHYPGVNPQSDGAGSLPGQARVAAHQQGRQGRK